MCNNNHNDDDLEESIEFGIFCLCFWVKYFIKRKFDVSMNVPARVLPVAETNHSRLPIVDIEQQILPTNVQSS
jgi:hypothetical protein